MFIVFSEKSTMITKNHHVLKKVPHLKNMRILLFLHHDYRVFKIWEHYKNVNGIFRKSHQD